MGNRSALAKCNVAIYKSQKTKTNESSGPRNGSQKRVGFRLPRKHAGSAPTPTPYDPGSPSPSGTGPPMLRIAAVQRFRHDTMVWAFSKSTWAWFLYTHTHTCFLKFVMNNLKQKLPQRTVAHNAGKLREMQMHLHISLATGGQPMWAPIR